MGNTISQMEIQNINYDILDKTSIHGINLDNLTATYGNSTNAVNLNNITKLKDIYDTRKVKTFTIGTTWGGSKNAWTQTVSVSGITSSQVPIVFLDTTSYITQAKLNAALKVWNTINISTADGKLQVKSVADTKPSTQFTCKAIVFFTT